jgi:hypothetical protein
MYKIKRNKRSTEKPIYLNRCLDNASHRFEEPVDKVKEAFSKVLQAEGYKSICQVCHLKVVWLEGKMNTASMNHTVNEKTYVKIVQQLETNCLICNHAYKGLWGNDCTQTNRSLHPIQEI